MAGGEDKGRELQISTLAARAGLDVPPTEVADMASLVGRLAAQVLDADAVLVEDPATFSPGYLA